MTDPGRGFEALCAGLWDGSDQVAGLKGCYIFRSAEENFHDTCRDASDAAGSCALALFDPDGCPKGVLKSLVSSRACAAGLLFLEEVHVVPCLCGGSKGLDFAAAVLRCLSGPLKRVTLAVCKEDAAAASVLLDKRGARAGFGKVTADGQSWLFLEPSATCARLAGRAKSKATRKVRCRAACSDGNRTLNPQAIEDGHTPTESSRDASSTRPTLVPSKPAPATSLKRPQAALVGGRLTLRTHYAMMFAADAGAQTLRLDAEQFRNGIPGGHYWGCECFPAPLRRNVFKAFVRGAAGIVDVVRALLRVERLPLPREVLHALAPFDAAPARELGLRVDKHAISHFFGKGGRVEHILRAVIEDATSFYDDRECTEEDPSELTEFGDYHQLPNHMLDGDFDFVKSIFIPECPVES
eukprot:CAMPEP_0171078444 /NCGR_PEP_ID=MMETSP0766_2-20121228/14647_1 /TAXON_ID=439317 /ORGANISM="Gambierdiscus australes, Strain CAWD 149" /LENGTH=410 /DNA_ID=CAMNT_0011535577 /DNA_START=33 /DNA_END=1265 /DNA_ORIENTATION=+